MFGFACIRAERMSLKQMSISLIADTVIHYVKYSKALVMEVAQMVYLQP